MSVRKSSPASRKPAPPMGDVLRHSELSLVFPGFSREKQMSESEICVKCHGCCMYVTAPLEAPRSRHQKDMFRWYLLHRNVEIYIDLDRRWQILFKTPCDRLLADGACSVYETRPDICREYQADACSRTGKDHLELFQTPDDLEAYLQRKSRTSKKAIKQKGPGRT